MKLKILLTFILSFILSYSFAQNITPSQIEHSQDILRREEAMRKKIEQPNKVFIKEVILPQDCAILAEEIKQINLDFSNHWHTLNEIQELLNSLAKKYQQVKHLEKPVESSYSIEKGRLVIDFSQSTLNNR